MSAKQQPSQPHNHDLLNLQIPEATCPPEKEKDDSVLFRETISDQQSMWLCAEFCLKYWLTDPSFDHV